MFADFDFAFDPALAPAPPLPPSADLFSPDETTDLLGFLDNFADLAWHSLDPFDRHPPPHSSSPRTRAAHASRSDRSTPPSPASASTATPAPPPPTPSAPNAPRSKPLLSSPQKRLNHIMSEQKRRNAIRDGYAQLIALMAPAGTVPGLGMPTRGRPKGSGSRGNGESKGKSGVLFRAVEYCRWLEDGRTALRDEVARVENAVAAIGLRG